jgi:hypothetical protein
MGLQCPSGYETCGGKCYEKCPAGTTNDCKGNCLEPCPAGWKENGEYCLKPSDSDYSNGPGFDDLKTCTDVAGGCYKCSNGKYYPNCLPGYEEKKCSVCTLSCPSDPNEKNGKMCKKKIATRVKVSPSVLSWSLVFFIITIVIVAIVIFIRYLEGNKITRESAFDIQYGEPGKSDAYAVITGKKISSQEFYV